MTKLDREPNYDGYWRCLEDLNKREIANSDTYDKSLLNLSTILLGLSITFLDKAVPLEDATGLWLLVFSWLALSTTILVVLASIIYGQKVLARLKDGAKSYFIDGDDVENNLSIYLSNNIARLNLASGIAFYMGVISLVLFVVRNIFVGASP